MAPTDLFAQMAMPSRQYKHGARHDLSLQDEWVGGEEWESRRARARLAQVDRHTPVRASIHARPRSA
ncbi:hypothetical protein [Xanthomonas indica]|uniref:Uncharacterized protein n=1 Tax=Xanthomonas indica TaxID=2912242 RepID=A0AAU8I9X0_9XANT|nr:hypothetical protein [Xanthomonas indica]MCI2260033.1 hypothetical protein [Xanthomonas indica]